MVMVYGQSLDNPIFLDSHFGSEADSAYAFLSSKYLLVFLNRKIVTKHHPDHADFH